MARFIINGGRKLSGKVRVPGNKNSALKLLPASLLADSPSFFTNSPVIRDVEVLLKIMKKLGVKVTGIGTNSLEINPANLSSFELDKDLTARIRASVVLAAPLLCRFGKAVITPPGGDQIGERLLDTHFSMMKNFGVHIEKSNGKYNLNWKKKKSTYSIFLEEASVTATEMALILATAVEKEVTIEGAACEPHVGDLAFYLSKMGVDIKGIGTNSLLIRKKGELKGVKHKIIPDHIDGGTFAIAAAITGGELLIQDTPQKDYQMICYYLKSMGVRLKFEGDNLIIKPSKLIARNRKFQTRPWPGFPTDLMSPFIVLATQSKGTVLCHDWMYEWRVFFVDDLITMGANIFIADPHRVIVSGPTKLNAEELFCKDIRAGMSVILAALVAEGKSRINNIEMVGRGYQDLENRLKKIGAEIRSENGSKRA